MVSVKAIDIKHIVEVPEDDKMLCHIANYPSDNSEMPHYYVSAESFVELHNRWLIALQAWNHSKVE